MGRSITDRQATRSAADDIAVAHQTDRSQWASGSRLLCSDDPELVRAYALVGPRGPSTSTRRISRARSRARSVEVSVAGLTPERHFWMGPNRTVPYLPNRDTTHTAHFFPTTSIRPIGGHGHSSSPSQHCDTMSVRSGAL